MRRYVSSKPVTPKRIAAASARPAEVRRHLIMAALLATTALTAAPVTAFAADKVVDGVTETIATPQNFDNVTVGDTLPNSQLDIVSGGALGALDEVFVGNQSGSVGTLTISGGGAASAGSFVAIGNDAGSLGTVTVSGAGSILTATDVGVGVAGQGALTISGGGTVSAGSVVAIGFATGSSGTVAVSGAGSTLTSTSDIRVGMYGSGSLTVDGGGVASSSNSVFVGESAGSIGTVTVSGAGSQLTAAVDIDVGAGGRGTLIVSNGGLASASANVFVGDDVGSVGSVTVSGAGSRLTANSGAYVGNNGAGTLTISDGGSVESIGRFFVGVSATATGTVTVSGSGSTLTVNNNLAVGFFGAGTLLVSNGGVVNASQFFVGSEIDSQGTVVVSGAGSKLTANAGVGVVGDIGAGTLTVSNGGVVETSGSLAIARNIGSSGTLNIGAAAGAAAVAAGNVFGAGGAAANIQFGAGTGEIVFNHTDTGLDFTANVSGNGTILVQSGTTKLSGTVDIGTGRMLADGGTLQIGGSTTAFSAYIGNAAGSSATVTVSGSGSTLTADPGGMIVGLRGNGTLTVSDGGQVSSTNGVIVGDEVGAQGTVTVSGTGSKLTTASIVVGAYGTGTLNVTNAGEVVANGNLAIGSDAGQGTVTVSGTGSKLTAAGNMFLGIYGNGTLVIANGGVVESGYGVSIGAQTGSLGTVTVSGSGSRFTTSSSFTVGSAGTGTLIVSDGSLAEAGSDIVVAALAGSSGTLTISGAGRVRAFNNVAIGSGAGSSGTATVSGAGSTLATEFNLFVGRAGNGTLTISGGGAVQSGSNVFIADRTGSSGTVTISGAGSTLDAIDIAVGNYGAGTLAIAGGGVARAVGNVTIGYVAGSSGAVTVSGAGSQLVATNNLIVVGREGSGALTVSDGGAVSSGSFVSIGDRLGASGTVTVAGGGSTLTAGRGIYVGSSGNGTLTISGGAAVQGELVDVGSRAGSTGTVTVSGSGSTAQANSFFVGSSGSGSLTVANSGVVEAADTLTIAESSGSTGTLNIGAAAGMAPVAAGRVQGAGGAAASITFGAGTGAIVFNHSAVNYVFDANVSGSGTLSQFAGVTSLTGNFAGFTGATNVSGGTLSVDTLLGGPVNLLAGGTVGGTGTINDLIISAGGTLAPGSVASPYGTLTITNPLTFATGSFYAVRLSNGISSFAQVNSTAALGGATVNAVFGTTGSVSLQPYRILTASGGLNGSFDPLVGSNLANFKPTLSYNANDVYLSLAFAFPAGLNGNQQAVASALTKAFNATGTVPLVFGALDAQGLSQAAGETATGSQQTALDAMNRFMGLLSDPDAGGRGAEVGPDTGSAPLAYAGTARPADAKSADAMAAIASATKAPYLKAPLFVPSWKVWAAGFGGNEMTDGNATAGTSGMTSSIYGVAAGADYRLAPDWTAGFALAGGGSQFKVTGSGDGRSDLFQAGGFLRHTMGPAYVGAALAYGFQDVTTNRYVGSGRLQAKFDTNTVSGRIESGWRFFTPISGGVGVTPYAAVQVTTMLLPSYAENVVGGNDAFALAYGSKTVTDPVSELGIRTDRSYVLVDGAVVTLRSRAAWAHDFNPNRSASATFQALPLASFVVNGAAQASDAALTSASAEVAWADGWSASLSFDGTFSDVTRSYAGKAALRRAW